MSATPLENDLRRESDRIVQLIEDLGAMAGAPIRQRAEELAQRLVHLYGEGLARLMSIWSASGIDDPSKGRLLADPLVSSLLVLHGLHPAPEAAEHYDPGAGGPDVARPSSAPAQGLVQIDLSRSRAREER